MFELIEKLRNKPERSKKRIAFFTSLSFCLIIFVIWVSVIYPDFKQKEDKEKKVRELAEVTPISSVGSTFSSGFNEIKDRFKSVFEDLKSFSASTEYFVSTSTPTETTEQGGL